MLLWVNLVTDGAPALAIGADPKAEDLLRRKPRSKEEAVIDQKIRPTLEADSGGIELLNYVPGETPQRNNFV